MENVSQSILTQLKKIEPTSHKGDNGRVFVIAGSDKYHGALLLTAQAVSRIVDMVYVHSVERNMPMVEQLRYDTATFIGITQAELWPTVALADAIMIGPGLAESDENKQLVRKLLTDYPEKKVVIDATALWHVDPYQLRGNCIATPHAREFQNTFQCAASPENVLKMSAKYGCVIVLTGMIDYVSNGRELYANKTGNAGMTKGGTGDVLVGLIGGLYATNEALIAALAGAYLNGLAGDRLYERVGTFYNAEDLIGELGRVWHELI